MKLIINILKLFIPIIIIVILKGCKTSQFSQIGMQGVYFLKNDRSVKISLSGNTFTLIDSKKNGHMATPCCDTLAIGEFKVEDNFLVVNSPRYFNSIFLDMDVKEKTLHDLDSIVFHINNPIETMYHRYNSKGGELDYSLFVQPKGSSLEYFREHIKSKVDNKIVFLNPQRLSVNNFFIMIEPKSSINVKNISVREIYTLTYQVKNATSNFFEISIPQLTYGYISYKRLNSFYVKIINSNKILWEGEEFIR